MCCGTVLERTVSVMRQLEQSQRDSSFEHHTHMFKRMDKNIFIILP